MTRRPHEAPKHLIAVLGITGAGKTTFISRATGRNDLEVGHSLESCTKDIASYEMYLDGELVQLIDTPGFDDTYRSDADVLELLADWLHTSYVEGVMLTGVILLHPINANRVQGSERRRMRLFEKICGTDAYSKIVIGATMWNEIKCEEDGIRRMQERKESPHFWGNMTTGGARVVRHDDNTASARRILSMLCGDSDPMSLLIQEELTNNDVTLSKTSAGVQLIEDLEEKCKRLLAYIRKLQQEQKEKDEEIKELIEEKEELRRTQQQKEHFKASKFL
ncbi:hypothetical protein BFW01_g7349 [Lasiodiplodia theobromae]|nr:hypothetical protein BFW01_g7349 [Lasiodiplodia theobromae]